jgi:hypothetical protein
MFRIASGAFLTFLDNPLGSSCNIFWQGNYLVVQNESYVCFRDFSSQWTIVDLKKLPIPSDTMQQIAAGSKTICFSETQKGIFIGGKDGVYFLNLDPKFPRNFIRIITGITPCVIKSYKCWLLLGDGKSLYVYKSATEVFRWKCSGFVTDIQILKDRVYVRTLCVEPNGIDTYRHQPFLETYV